ncbi:helix-turn-helix domain-containing protein [Nocardia miyunensis]|uniref:helix-turn-helix domain-containing protein n=1 Tax=Nocardia miyunensis TaxID=282684 RepID=UPI0009FE42AC|nr:helix-turn-helix transcriptional regulator [Nocardia miyunensis]
MSTSGGSGTPVNRHERDDSVISLARWARAVRARHKLTRRQAEHATGISPDYLKNIEHGWLPSQQYLEKFITGYDLDAAQTRLTWDLWRPPVPLPPADQLRKQICTPDRLEFLALLDSAGIAIAYIDVAWNILCANKTFYRTMPDAGANTDGNFALWALPPAPEPSPAEPLLLHPRRDARWLVGMLRGGLGRYRTSPQVISMYQQLSRNAVFNHHWQDIHVTYGRCLLHEPLQLRNPITRQPYALDLQITELADIPAIRGVVAWPPPQPAPP